MARHLFFTGEKGVGKTTLLKSILGLMSLDFTRPVQVVCENRRALETVCQALAQ